MITDAKTVELKPCSPADAKRLFEWRNHPQIVSLSTRKKTVTWEEHSSWMDSCLAKPDEHRIFVIHESGPACGVLRFDRQGEGIAQVSISLEPGTESRGLGVLALEMGAGAIFDIWPELQKIHAYVLTGNQRALRAFAKAGFDALDGSDLPGHVLYRREREQRVQNHDPA